MNKKPTGKTTGTRAAPVTTTTTSPKTLQAVRQGLSRSTPQLAADEDKVLRMRTGTTVPHTLVLERVGQDHPDSRQKLLGIELELLRQWRERNGGKPDPRAQAKATTVAAAAPATANPKREKIVQALRRKPSK